MKTRQEIKSWGPDKRITWAFFTILTVLMCLFADQSAITKMVGKIAKMEEGANGIFLKASPAWDLKASFSKDCKGANA
jgi:hypothetical protein